MPFPEETVTRSNAHVAGPGMPTLTRRTLGVALATAALAALASCGESTAPGGGLHPIDSIGQLRLDVEIADNSIELGDSLALTMRLRNLSDESVRLGFGSSCQMMPYVETAGGETVHPGGGAWACAAVLTQLDVPARGEVVRTIHVRSAASDTGTLRSPLRRGRYRAYAELESSMNRQALRATAIEFEVR